MKKTLPFVLLVLTTLIGYSQSIHCYQDRYAQTPVFDSLDIDRTLETFSIEPRWPQNVIDTLKMEVFKPSNAVDVIEKRPFILMIHGGAFYLGNRNDMAYYSMEMARRGFVTATMSYRLGWDCNADNLLVICGQCGSESNKMKIATYRAVQDARAAIRFVIDHADAWGVDTTQIFLQGESAGSITALHTAFWNQDEANEYCPTCIDEVGELDATGLSPVVDFEIQGVIDNCGGINSVDIIGDANIPIVSFHDDLDCIVPIMNGKVLNCFNCNAFYWVNGSQRIHNQLNDDGTCGGLNIVPFSLNHCSYPRNAIIGKASCFIKGILCDECESYTTQDIWNIPDCLEGTLFTGIEHPNKKSFTLFPNPAKQNLSITSERSSNYKIQLYSLDGRLLLQKESTGKKTTLEVSSLVSGLYFIQLMDESGTIALKKVVVE